MRIKYFASLGAAIVMGCASAAGGGSSSGHTASLITREEIVASRVDNAYDAIQRLRPSFLRSHGASTLSSSDAGFPSVYLNGQLYGDIGSLKQIEVTAIQEIRYFTPAEASTRFGNGVPNGAIQVVTGAR